MQVLLRQKQSSSRFLYYPAELVNVCMLCVVCCCINFSNCSLLLACESTKKAALLSAALKQNPWKTSIANSYFLSTFWWNNTNTRPSLTWHTPLGKGFPFVVMLLFERSPATTDSVERLLVDPHEGPRLVGLAFVLDVAEFVAKLAVLPLVVVVVFRLPDRLKRPRLVKLDRKRQTVANCQIITNTMILVSSLVDTVIKNAKSFCWCLVSSPHFYQQPSDISGAAAATSGGWSQCRNILKCRATDCNYSGWISCNSGLQTPEKTSGSRRALSIFRFSLWLGCCCLTSILTWTGCLSPLLVCGTPSVSYWPW